jgi:hypothetical protein
MKAKVDELKARKEATKAGLDDSFYAEEKSLLPPEVAELRYSDDPADLKKYQDELKVARGEYEQKALESHDLDIAAAEDAYEQKASEIDKAEMQKAIEEAQAAFCQANPDCNLEELGEFYHMDMTKRQKDQIAQDTPKGDHTGYYQRVYDLMKSQGAGTKDSSLEESEEDKTPPSFDGNAIAATNPTGQGGDEFKNRIMGGA